MTKELLQQALDALKSVSRVDDDCDILAPSLSEVVTESIEALKEFLAQPVQVTNEKLWLWKNFVDGRPEYWAFDNAYPVNMDGGDPQTLGDPCGYAVFKPSINGRTDVNDEQVLKRIAKFAQPVERKPLTDEQIDKKFSSAGILDCLRDPYDKDGDGDEYGSVKYDIRRIWRSAEAAHGIKEPNEA